jgi:hypothetical protein
MEEQSRIKNMIRPLNRIKILIRPPEDHLSQGLKLLAHGGPKSDQKCDPTPRSGQNFDPTPGRPCNPRAQTTFGPILPFWQYLILFDPIWPYLALLALLALFCIV